VLLNQDTEGFVDLFASDGALEIPFGGPDLPARLYGQQAIRDYSRRIAASALRIDTLWRRGAPRRGRAPITQRGA